MTTEPRYLKVADVARRLNLEESTVYKMCRRGEIPSVTIGQKAVRVPVDALERYERMLAGKLRPVYMGAEEARWVSSIEQERGEFKRLTGMTPEEWVRRWREDDIPDTPENGRLAIRALALRDAAAAPAHTGRTAATA